MTFERRLEDNPTYDSYFPDDSLTPAPGVRYSEGVFLGYRYYTTRRKPTLFPFGYGLSYTTFRLSNLKIDGKENASDPSLLVSFDVTNTGSVEGTEVPQIYVSEQKPVVLRPIRELKGFSKVRLQPHETRHVTVKLSERSFAYFDAVSHGWKTDAGQYMIQVGTSSEQISLEKPVTLN